METIDIIKAYMQLEKSLSDWGVIVGIEIGNGRRLIVKWKGANQYLLIDNRLQIVKMDDDTVMDTPLTIIRGYIKSDDGTPLKDIKIFEVFKPTKAYLWLQKRT